MNQRATAEAWARGLFEKAALGDARRTARLIRVAARAAERPSGKLSEVFTSARELDAAYDFVERDNTSTTALELAVGSAAARGCAGRVHVVVDGSSAKIVDGT